MLSKIPICCSGGSTTKLSPFRAEIMAMGRINRKVKGFQEYSELFRHINHLPIPPKQATRRQIVSHKHRVVRQGDCVCSHSSNKLFVFCPLESHLRLHLFKESHLLQLGRLVRNSPWCRGRDRRLFSSLIGPDPQVQDTFPRFLIRVVLNARP